MSKYKILSTTKPSHEFLSALGGGGSYAIECSFCGRHHYAPESRNWDPGELESYDRHAKEDPEGYIVGYSSDFIHYHIIQDLIYPDDCPCNGIYKYEQFMWAYRQEWADFLTQRRLKLQGDLDSIVIPEFVKR